jgi:C-terminal processing protease CtpA/Prc
VYLKYNQCVDGREFGKTAAEALTALRMHPGYRLIVDLRDNPGGNSGPFQALIDGIRADPAINRRGRIFGLINGGTASSATLDANSLGTETRAILMGEPVEDPVDEFGNNDAFLTLPHSHLQVQYTTAVINSGRIRYGTPDIVITPTISQVLVGTDPVLDRAFSYPR